MSSYPLVRPLESAADRQGFDCGDPELTRWLREQAGQAQSKRLATVWIASPPGEPRRIIGYYSLAPSQIQFEDAPKSLRKRLSRYPLAVAVLARLAVDRRFQGRGWGEFLLVDALRRALRAARAVPAHAILVHARHERAAAFYEKYGFLAFGRNPLHLYLPMGTIERLVDEG